jgi:DNA-binding NtrC family response regulator
MQSNGSVLLLEDDDDLRPIICELLDDVGYRAVGVRDMDAARGVLAGENIDVVLLDWNLSSGENSRELLDELTETDGAPPVVMFSAAAGAPAIAAIYELPFVPKPCEVNDLEDKLRDAVETRRASVA